MRHPLLVPAVSLAAGIVAGRLVEFGSRQSALYLALCIALAATARLTGSLRLARMCTWLALVFAGLLVERLHRPGPNPQIDAQPREIMLLEGCVIEPPSLFPGREQFTLELEPGARVRVSLYPRPGQPPPKLHYGQRVELEARLRLPRNFGNPGAFDYVRYLARREIYWTASATANSNLKILPGGCGDWIGQVIYGMRSAALDRLEAIYAGRPYQTGMMQALLIGETAKVDEDWTDQYRLTGTYHALVISGMHLTALTAVLFLLLRLFPSAEILPLAAGSVFAWIYTMITGWQTPVVRAAAGLTLFLAARYFYRRQRLLNLVAAVAICILLFDPPQLFEASFQLTFLCVIAIAAFAIPLMEKISVPYSRGLRALDDQGLDLHLPRVTAAFRVELRLLSENISLWSHLPEHWIQRGGAVILRVVFYFWELFLLSASVQIGLALPMVLYFHRLSVSGLSANMAVVPLLSCAVPAGFLAVFTGWSAPATVAGWLLEASRRVVEWHAAREPLWRVPDPPLWLVFALSSSLLWLALSTRWRPPWRWLAGAAAGGFLILLLWHPFPPRVRRGMLEVAAIDVGQGDALFLAFPDGRLMLVDTGGFPAYGMRRSGIDTGEDVISPYLWTRSIKRLDVVVVSHLHEDHAGGLEAILKNFRPHEVWTGALPQSAEARKMRELVRAAGARLRPLEGGEALDFGGARIVVLAPPPEDYTATAISDQDSLAFQVAFGKRSFLLTGDLEPRVEFLLAGQGALPRSDVLKVPHHGSRTSTGDAMLEQVRPLFALISAEYANPYNHPHPQLLERLGKWGAVPLRTDVLGLVSVLTDGARLEVSSQTPLVLR